MNLEKLIACVEGGTEMIFDVLNLQVKALSLTETKFNPISWILKQVTVSPVVM